MHKSSVDSGQKTKTISRRDVLRGIGVSGAAALVPGISNAVTRRTESQGLQTQDPNDIRLLTEHHGLAIEIANARSLTNEPTTVQIKITNQSDQNVVLKALAPGAFRVCGNEYNLNKRFDSQPLKLHPRAEYNLWLSPETGDCTSHASICPIDIDNGIPVTIVERSADNSVLIHTEMAQVIA